MAIPSTLYAQPSDLIRYCTNAPSIAGVAVDVQRAALEDASREFDNHIKSIFSGQNALPLVEWDNSVRKNVCWMACYEIFRVRGFDPNRGSDVLIVKDRDDAKAWMLRVQRQEIRPYMVGQPSAPLPVNEPIVRSKPLKGY